MEINIGFIGYSDTKFNLEKANEIVDDIFDEIISKYSKRYDVINIISGATNIGIPSIIYHKAVNENENSICSFNTIGIMCKDGYNYELFPCDIIYAVGNNWGDESETFLSKINVLYKIGGGKQSIEEYNIANKNKEIICREYKL